MSYTPTEWKTGDVVTSAKLNKMEQGIADASSGGGALVVNAVYDETTEVTTLDKTWREIHDAIAAGKPPIITVSGENEGVNQVVVDFVISALYSQNDGYYIQTMDANAFTTDSENGYPSSSIGG